MNISITIIINNYNDIVNEYDFHLTLKFIASAWGLAWASAWDDDDDKV